ncbi:serine hydrolase domain-containing protein [Mucilaginibacter lutimaris]|uniref:Serine hydrolase domain-containing protein n=1 Tax=Mucilaginibacter lutimaris TaxID=931629 RepID=A0ABW2ZAT3_9SPHI
MKSTYILLALLLITGIASAQNKLNRIDSLIKEKNKQGLFNGNVLVAENGKVIYRTAIGYADTTKQVQLTTAYRFHIGSIAKEFNAVSIMMLQEQGKLNIDDKINKYLNGMPGWANNISIKNLLQYSSGIPNLNWKALNGDADALAAIKAIEKPDFEAGTQYAYNNSNTFLQRQIIEKVSGMKFNDFVSKKLLKPLGMNNSIVDPVDSTPFMAISYNNSFVRSPLVYPITGWTAVTLDDFYKWEKGLENFKLINPESTRQILTPFAPNRQCGLGGGTMDGPKLITHQHDGTAMNYQALLTASVPKGRTVILMTNNKQNNLYDINNAIEAIMDDKP